MHFIVCPVRPTADPTINGDLLVTDKTARDALKKYYLDKDQAIGVAKELAAKFPTVQFAVFEPCFIFETLVPKVITKKMNDRGEIVVAQEE